MQGTKDIAAVHCLGKGEARRKEREMGGEAEGRAWKD